MNEQLTKILFSKALRGRWLAMKQRCYDPKHISYPYYGGKGIKVVWSQFKEFEKDVGEAFIKHVIRHGMNKTQLDRIDNKGHYSKENCGWTTPKNNCRKRATSRPIAFNGKTRLIGEWAKELGLSKYTLHKRIFRLNWDIERSLTTKT